MVGVANLDDYILPSDPIISGYPDASAAFGRAVADDRQLIVGTPGGIYYVKDVILDSRQFDGRECVLRDAPGARWGIRLDGFAPALRRVSWQDQGNYVSVTRLATAAGAGAMALNVENAAGIEVGDAIFVGLDTGEVRHQSFVAGVAGTMITLRDGLPGAAGAGRSVEAMLSAIRVGEADHWLIEDVLVINARGALLLKPDGGKISNRGSLVRFQVDGSHYFGVLKAGDTAGVKAQDIKLWCGFVETTLKAADGTAGPFPFPKKLFLLRDVTVSVNGVKKIRGIDWDYASQQSIKFLSGHIPPAGAAIEIAHFRNGYCGFVDDQRSTSIISGGNLYDAVEVLGAFVGVTCHESELTEFRSLISDSCQYVALSLVGCTNSLVFSSDTFLGFSGSSMKMFGSNPKNFISLYTRRVPPSEQWPVPADANIYFDSASDFRVNAAGWSGEFHTAGDGKLSIVAGYQFEGHSEGTVTGGTTTYLCQSGARASTADATLRAPRDGTFKRMRVDVDIAPGAGQSFTYDVLANGVSAGQVKIEGASRYSVVKMIDFYVVEGTPILLRLTSSAGAATAARHIMSVTLI